MSVESALIKIKQDIPAHVKLVAVSKTYPSERILEAYQTGQTIFGENRVQELVEKQMALPADIEWHLIGHLQKNKVKYIASFVSLIHAVDNTELFLQINKEGMKVNRVMPCLIQIHIAEEESKFGFSYAEAERFFDSFSFAQAPFVQVCGLMGMASFTSNTDQVRGEFKKLSQFFKQLKTGVMNASPHFKELSMGMSGDYKIAIEEGSTIVRIGSAIFGNR
jgi:pyridoxal phosphate enzyme (YggS family)